MDGKVLTFVKKADASKCEEFIEEYLTNLKKMNPQPVNLMVIEYNEDDDMSKYNLYIGGPGRMRPHHLVGILMCLADEVAGQTSV